jgi:hypothetical protein
LKLAEDGGLADSRDRASVHHCGGADGSASPDYWSVSGGVYHSAAGGSESRDFRVSLGDSPLDSVVFHNQQSDLRMSLGNQVSEDRVKLVYLDNRSGTRRGWSTDLLLDLLDDLNRLLDVLNWAWNHNHTGIIFSSIELVSLNIRPSSVHLTGSDTRGVKIVRVALAKSGLESLRLIECHLILILLKV